MKVLRRVTAFLVVMLWLSTSVRAQSDLAGTRILAFSSSPVITPLFRPELPIWQTLRREGATIQFQRKSLGGINSDDFDQLWLFSGKESDAKTLGTFDADQIIQWVKDGKGLYLATDNFPFTFEGSVIANKLFGASIEGEYSGTRILKIDRDATHPLLEGIKVLMEGCSVGQIANTEKLRILVNASNGKPLIAVPKQGDLKVVIDCGYTRYYCTPAVRRPYGDSNRFIRNAALFLNRNESTSYNTNSRELTVPE